MTTLAVMQPYFIPYAGYFRLFAAADLFVVYDCVQFPRRGWVHRNRLTGADGQLRWLTLPLAHAPRETAIKDMRLADDAGAEMPRRIARHPLLARSFAHPLLRRIAAPPPVLIDALVEQLADITRHLGLSGRMVRSSALGIAPGLRGQQRILAICQALGARTYVNAPGGRSLYDPAAFASSGIALRFLAPWQGSCASILERLLREDAAAVAADIRRQTVCDP